MPEPGAGGGVSDPRGAAVLLCGGQLRGSYGKTAHGLIRGSTRFEVVGVVDGEATAGKDAGVLVDGLVRGIPVFARLGDALARLARRPAFAIIGVATAGGVLPPDLRAVVRQALGAGLTVVSGLHEILGDDSDLSAAAAAGGGGFVDVRRPRPREVLHFWTGAIAEVAAPRVAVLGTDCAVGKRTTARLLVDACGEAGIDARLIYTGQTGWMEGWCHGFILDATPNDFVSGELEHAIVSCAREHPADLLLIEGQSALRNPSGPCGAELLLSGAARAVVLQHAPARAEFKGLSGPLARQPTLASEVRLIEAYGAAVLAVTLHTEGMTPRETEAFVVTAEAELGVPVIAPLDVGVERVVERLVGVVGVAASAGSVR